MILLARTWAMGLSLRGAFAALLSTMSASAFAADPYAAWSQGRPAESANELTQEALASQRWDRWLDAGLAHLAADDRGHAAAAFLMAHHLAPQQPEPREALRAIEIPLPTTWLEWAGPIAWPGVGWPGVVIIGLGGIALGYGLGSGLVRRRWRSAIVGGGLLVLAAPGQLGWWHDHHQPWGVVVRDTHQLDSTGSPTASMAGGTLVRMESDDAWAGRRAVRLLSGTVVFLAEGDVGDPSSLRP